MNYGYEISKIFLQSTSNYVARQYGVRSAMPGFMARKICPQLKIVPCNFDKYRKASKQVLVCLEIFQIFALNFWLYILQVREIFKEYDKNFVMGSLDEAYLDITEYVASRIDSGLFY